MTDMKIKSGLRKNMVRGPLKAMPSTAVKQPQKSSEAVRSVFKRIHQNSNVSSNSSNNSLNGDVDDKNMALYDEYLCTKLMLLNVKQNHKEAKKAANKDILDLWTGIEQVRSEIVAQEKANEELKVLAKFREEAGEYFLIIKFISQKI